MLHVALAVGATLVAAAFSMSTFERWLARRRPYELVWTIAFLQFAIAAVALTAGSEAGWTTGSFRVFYLFGAILDVAFLGLGEIMLLCGENTSRWATRAVMAFAVFSAGVMVATGFVAPLPIDELAQGSRVLPVLPRVLAAVGSGLGALTVLGGTLFSALKTRNRRNLTGNLLIAGGTVVSGASGLANSVWDAMTAFSVTLTVGIALLFLGFLVVTSSSRTREDAPNSTAFSGTLRPNSKNSPQTAIEGG